MKARFESVDGLRLHGFHHLDGQRRAPIEVTRLPASTVFELSTHIFVIEVTTQKVREIKVPTEGIPGCFHRFGQLGQQTWGPIQTVRRRLARQLGVPSTRSTASQNESARPHPATWPTTAAPCISTLHAAMSNPAPNIGDQTRKAHVKANWTTRSSAGPR